MRYLESVSNAILDRSPDELIGALLIASMIAGIVAGMYALRHEKQNRGSTFVGALSLVAGLMCMALTAGYFEYKRTPGFSPAALRGPSGGHRTASPPPRPEFRGRGRSPGFHIVAAADENRDGRVTPEEAADLVRQADVDGDGSVEISEIDRLIGNRLHARDRTDRSHNRDGADAAIRTGLVNGPTAATHVEE